MCNLPSCKKLISLRKHAGLRESTRNTSRLTFSKEEDTLLRLIKDPFSSDIEELTTNLQMEVTELQNWPDYRNKHEESSLPEFCSSLDVTKFNKLRDSALQFVCVFWNMYIC
jgi:hypothetical protein